MSLPRHLSLRRGVNDWHLVQSPQSLAPLYDRTLVSGARAAGSGLRLSTTIPVGSALEIKTRFRVTSSTVTTLRFSNDTGEHLDVGYDADAAQLFIDRGEAQGFKHHFFTDKFAAALVPGTREIDLHIIFDRCTLEVFADRGAIAGSALHFFNSPPNRLSVLSNGHVAVTNMQVRTLKPALPQ